MAGRIASPEWLATAWILSAFDDRELDARLAYRRFVSAGRGQPGPWVDLAHQVFLGDESFIDDMRARIEQSDRVLDEVPRAQRARRARPLIEYENEANTRNQAIALAYASGGYSMQAIGSHFGLHYSWISRIVQKHETEHQPNAKR